MKIFVYGTLKKGFYFHDSYLKDSNFLGKATTTKDYTLYVEALPSMIKAPSDTGVKGELYEVTPETLKALDGLEGHPSFYYRDLINVIDKDGNNVVVWGYLRPKNFSGKNAAFIEEEFV